MADVPPTTAAAPDANAGSAALPTQPDLEPHARLFVRRLYGIFFVLIFVADVTQLVLRTRAARAELERSLSPEFRAAYEGATSLEALPHPLRQEYELRMREYEAALQRAITTKLNSLGISIVRADTWNCIHLQELQSLLHDD